MIGNAERGIIVADLARRLHLLNVTAGERSTFSISEY